MPKNNHYKWLELQMLLHAAASQETNNQLDADGAGGDLQLRCVWAQAGIFENASTKSANDLAATAFILLVLWCWSCAIYRANVAAAGLRSRKLTPGRFFEAVGRYPAIRLHFGSSDHFPVTAAPCAISSASSQ